MLDSLKNVFDTFSNIVSDLSAFIVVGTFIRWLYLQKLYRRELTPKQKEFAGYIYQALRTDPLLSLHFDSVFAKTKLVSSELRDEETLRQTIARLEALHLLKFKDDTVRATMDPFERKPRLEVFLGKQDTVDKPLNSEDRA